MPGDWVSTDWHMGCYASSLGRWGSWRKKVMKTGAHQHMPRGNIDNRAHRSMPGMLPWVMAYNEEEGGSKEVVSTMGAEG